MNNKKYFIKDVIYCLLVLGIFFLGVIYGTVNNASMGAVVRTKLIYFELPLTIVIPVIIYILFGVVLYIAFKSKYIKVNKFFIISTFALIIMVFYLGLLSLFKDNQHLINLNNIEYHADEFIERLKAFFDVTIMFLNIFLLFNLVKGNTRVKHLSLYIYCGGIILFAFVAVVYSITNELELYKYVISNLDAFVDKDVTIMFSIKSFFNVGNAFSHFCNFAIMALLVLSFEFKGKWIMLFSIPFFFFVLAGGSRTGTLALLTLYFIYIVYLVFDLRKKHKIAFYISLSLLVLLVVYLTLETYVFKQITYTSNKGKVYTISDMFELLNNVLVTNRFRIFLNIFNYYTPLDYLLGQGYQIDMYSVRSFGDFNYHNSFMEIFMAGGIPLSIFYVSIFVYLVYLLIKAYKKGNKQIIIMFAILAIFNIQYSISESVTIFFNYDIGGTMSYLFVVPLLFSLENKSGTKLTT